MKFFVKINHLVIAAALAAPAAALAKSPNPLTQLEGFDIAREPGKADWRYFIKAPEASREALWTYHVKQGKQLKDWAWGWRLGWVRVCSRSERPLCAKILGDALQDKALVVRAEAATRIGQRFEGTGDARVVTALAAAYRDQRNTRHGRPLYVQSRLLYALHQVGGDAALKAGRDLAAAHPETLAYWRKLEASSAAAVENGGG